MKETERPTAPAEDRTCATGFGEQEVEMQFLENGGRSRSTSLPSGSLPKKRSRSADRSGGDPQGVKGKRNAHPV